MNVSSLITRQHWNLSQIAMWSNIDILDNIRKLTLPPSPQSDKWFWNHSANGLPITKSIYKVFCLTPKSLTIALISIGNLFGI